MKKSRKEVPANHKKIRKIVKIILGSVVGFFVLMIIIGAFTSGGANYQKEQDAKASTESTEKPQEATSSTQESKPADKSNQSQKAYAEAVSQLYVINTNLGSDFGLISDAIQAQQTDGVQALGKDLDKQLDALNQLQSNYKGVNPDDLTDASNASMIDTQITETVKDLIDVTSTYKTALQSYLDGTTTQDQLNELDRVETLYTNQQTMLKSLDGISNNEDNWK